MTKTTVLKKFLFASGSGRRPLFNHRLLRLVAGQRRARPLALQQTRLRGDSWTRADIGCICPGPWFVLTEEDWVRWSFSV